MLLYALAMSIAGAVPALLSAIGLWLFLQRGVVLSRSGERMDSLWAWYYVALLLVGLALIIHAVRYYRRRSDSAARAPGDE